MHPTPAKEHPIFAHGKSGSGSRLAAWSWLLMVLAWPVHGWAADDDYVYKVVNGDTLIGLTGKLLKRPADWPQVARHNGLRNPNLITPGAELRVPLAFLNTTMLPVTVSHVQGDARADANVLAVGAKLSEGARVSTGKDGYVTLTLHDGSTVQVMPATQVEVERQRTYAGADFFESSIKLLAGRVEALVEKFRGGGAMPRRGIATPLANLTVRGTRYRVSADGATRSEVIEGVVAVAGGGGTKQIDAGFGSVVEQGRVPSDPIALLRAPDVTKLAALQERPLLRFAVPVVAGAREYRAQIARDETFNAVVAEAVFNSPEIRLADVADGRYFLRLRAVDERGLEGRDAVHAFTLKARPEPPLMSTPASRGKVRAEAVRFQWSENTDAAHYHLQVASDAVFKNVLYENKALKGDGVTAKLPLGNYFWRVASLRANGERGPYGDTASFALLAPPANPDPPAISDKEVRFRWGAEPGQTFEFELAQDPGFASPMLTSKVDKPEVALPKPPPGKYFMRVRATDPDGFVGPYSAVQLVTIPLPPPLPPRCLRDSNGQCVSAGSGIVDAAY